jgi:hypothetical protein
MPNILIDQIYNATFPLITAVVGYVGGLFLPGFSKEFFAERARKARHKLDVAIQVHKICNEASTGKFQHWPRDMEHINSVLTDLDGVDKKMGETMNSFVSLWRDCVRAQQTVLGVYAGRHYKEILGEVEEKRITLVAWANKIRAGN